MTCCLQLSEENMPTFWILRQSWGSLLDAGKCWTWWNETRLSVSLGDAVRLVELLALRDRLEDGSGMHQEPKSLTAVAFYCWLGA